MIPLTVIRFEPLAQAALPYFPGAFVIRANAAPSLAPRVIEVINELSPESPVLRIATLEQIRAATEKYQDPEVALADGYIREPMNLCAHAADEDLPPQVGAMGVHFFRPDQLGIDARTVRRYVAALQDLGIPVEGQRGVGGGYRIRPGYRLPPLMLSDDEAVVVALG